MWSHILHDQLGVDEATFWACLQSSITPDRGVITPPAAALPADLVHLLLTRLHLSESEVASLSKHEAVQRLTDSWSAPDVESSATPAARSPGDGQAAQVSERLVASHEGRLMEQ